MAPQSAALPYGEQQSKPCGMTTDIFLLPGAAVRDLFTGHPSKMGISSRVDRDASLASLFAEYHNIRGVK